MNLKPQGRFNVVCSFARFQQYKNLKGYTTKDSILREMYEDHMIEFAAGGRLADLHKASSVYTEITLNEMFIEGTRKSLDLPVIQKEGCYEQEDQVF